MKNVLDYFENTVTKYARKTAVDDGNILMTWEELQECSMKIGTALLHRTCSGRAVVILMKKSAMTLAAMIGAVYAGCFYTVIDPEQPADRLCKILRISGPEIVLTCGKDTVLPSQIRYQGQVLSVEEAVFEKADENALKAVRRKTGRKDILYCMFTSGSTGTPKGVAVSHDAVIKFISHFTELFQVSDEDRIGNQAPFDFDVSVKDIYSCMFTGAMLVLIPQEMFAVPPVLLDYLCRKRVSILIWAVSALTTVSSLKGLDYRVPTNVKKILFSGEIMPVRQLKKWQTALPEAAFVNLYGPTEVTCNCTWYPIEKNIEEDENIPIGRPLPGRDVFLLDSSEKIVTRPGEQGEICVAGESLAEGYYHDPAETEKKFRVRPGTQDRYYRTGDLGYYGRNGAMYFSGRKDFQIKHMGHRIELEEIELELNRIRGVEKTCCFPGKNNRYLVAVYTGSAAEKDVRNDIKEKLPAYMVPQKIQWIRQLPMTRNGKTDRRRLAECFGE